MTLPKAEFKLLASLLDRPRTPIKRITLHTDLEQPLHGRSVDLTVSRLRRRLRDHGVSEDLICTLHNLGYRLNADVERLPARRFRREAVA